MIYRFLRILMRLVLRVFFRKVFFSYAERIPRNQPVILACNHPNSFLDAVLLAVLLPRPLYFLARSDVFNTPFKRWLLARLHLIPIYRLEEGKENLQQNQDTFARCYEILKANGAVLIFSEGKCVIEKRLRPLRKGTARLALGAVAAHQGELELQVIPVGLNYTHPTGFRKEVMISVAEPIPVRDYWLSFTVNPAMAIRNLTAKIREGLEEHFAVINDPDQEREGELYLARHRAASAAWQSPGWFSRDREPLNQEFRICRQLNAGENPGAGPAPEPASPKQTLQLLLKVFTFPVYLLGYSLNILPLILARKITDSKVKLPEFRASVLMTVGMLLYLIYYFGVILIGLAWSWKTSLVLAAGLPLLGYLALRWQDAYGSSRMAPPPALVSDPVKSQRLQHPVG